MNKKVVNIIMYTICLLTLLCGCDEDDDGKKNQNHENNTYNLYWFDLPTGKEYPEGFTEFEYPYSHIAEYGSDNLVYAYEVFATMSGEYAITVNHWENLEDYKKVPSKLMLFSSETLDYRLYEYEFDSLEVFPPQYSGVIRNLVSMPDGGFCAYVGFLSESKIEAERYSFVRWDAEGNRVYARKLDEFPYPMLKEFVSSQSGNLYFIFDGSVSAMSAEGEHLYTVEIPESLLANDMYDIKRDGNGNVVLCYARRTNNEWRYFYRIFDDEKQELGVEIALPEVVRSMPEFAPGYDFYCITNNGVQAINSDGESVYLVRWVDYNLTLDLIDDIQIISDDRIFIKATDPSTNELKLALLTPNEIENKVAQTASAQTKTITIAYVASDSNYVKNIESYATSFNLSNQEYRIEMIPYTSEKTMTPNDKLIKEMLAGQSPDMIMFDSDLSYESFVKLGVFRDMYEFMDKDDTYDRDAFLPCVLTPFENEKGELPYLTMQLGLSTLTGLQSVVGDRSGWTAEEMLDFVLSLDDEQVLFDFTESYGSDSVSALLQLILPNMVNQYIDYESGTVDFGDDLANLLELCMNTPISRSVNGVYPIQYHDGTVALRPNTFNTVEAYLQIKYAFFNGEQTDIGYPANDASGTVLVPVTCLAITKQSQVADGAWDFIKYCLDLQLNSWIDSADESTLEAEDRFPCTKAAMDEMFVTLKNYYFYYSVTESFVNPGRLMYSGNARGARFSENGEYRESHKTKLEDPTITFYTLSEEDEAALRALFDSARTVRSYDTELLSIIYEDAAYYFAGVKSLEDTVRIIEDRVDTLLNE
ncbi:MAG: hypothetical protein IJ493_11305 [Clostridia bacterium]|nr:hypothetical protein [Clostridia bacterium]